MARNPRSLRSRTSTVRRHVARVALEWSMAAGLASLVAVAIVACSGGASDGPTRRHASSRPEDFAAQPSDFHNLHDMTKVRGFYVDNRLGHLRQALAVANSPNGGQNPVGTILQLVPQEAMVKRRHGFNPATRDWEFFFLSVSPSGTVIEKRGTADVVNRFGGNCASCHSGAEPKFDMVCEHNHGCAPLPIGDDIIQIIQDRDPRAPTRAG